MVVDGVKLIFDHIIGKEAVIFNSDSHFCCLFYLLSSSRAMSSCVKIN